MRLGNIECSRLDTKLDFNVVRAPQMPSKKLRPAQPPGLSSLLGILGNQKDRWFSDLGKSKEILFWKIKRSDSSRP